MRAGLEVRLARVDERVREDHDQAQPAARRAPAVVRQRQAVRELVDRHEQEAPGDEHRAAEQRAGSRRRTACRTARRRGRRTSPSPASESRTRPVAASGEKNSAAPVAVGALEIVADPLERPLARLEHARAAALGSASAAGVAATPSSIPRSARSAISRASRPGPAGPSSRSASPSSSATVRWPSSSSNSAASSASIRRNAPPAQVAQDEALLALVVAEPLERPARAQPRAQATVDAGGGAARRPISVASTGTTIVSPGRASGPRRRLGAARSARRGAALHARSRHRRAGSAAPGTAASARSAARPTSTSRTAIRRPRSPARRAELDPRVHARHRLVVDPDRRVVAAADRQRPAIGIRDAVRAARARAAAARWERSWRATSATKRHRLPVRVRGVRGDRLSGSADWKSMPPIVAGRGRTARGRRAASPRAPGRPSASSPGSARDRGHLRRRRE